MDDLVHAIADQIKREIPYRLVTFDTKDSSWYKFSGQQSINIHEQYRDSFFEKETKPGYKLGWITISGNTIKFSNTSIKDLPALIEEYDLNHDDIPTALNEFITRVKKISTACRS